jgi:hypothetical protein
MRGKSAVFTVAVVLIMSGCICCGGKDPMSFLGKDKTTPEDDTGMTDGGEETTDTTEPSYDETTETTLESETETTETTETTEATDTTIYSEETTETTQVQATTTTAAAQGGTKTTNAVTNSAVYECVRAAGYNPDHVVYGYSQGCGDRYVSTASTVSIQKGVRIDAIKIGGTLDQGKLKMLECFYGPYSDANAQFSQCPVLLCPKSGEVKLLSGVSGMSIQSQMSGFALKC